MSTHDILKQGLCHVSDQSAFFTSGGGGRGGGGFGGIARFSRGNGREISSRQQIVQHSQPKRKTELKKKVKESKEKKP